MTVEISGMYTANMKRRANLYLWRGNIPIVDSVQDVRREDIGTVVEKLRMFVGALIDAGYGGDNVLGWRNDPGLCERNKLVHA